MALKLGRVELHKAYELIVHNGNSSFSFVGFVEGGDITSNKVDVIVTDGFTSDMAVQEEGAYLAEIY